MNLFGNRILVVVAHPDDELLGLGATLNKLSKDQKKIIRVVILGEGLTSRSPIRDVDQWEKDMEKHKADIAKAQKNIGYDELATYNFPDNRFDSVNLLDIIKVVEKEILLFKPEAILTHHGGDLNIDHQRTFEAVITATRPIEIEWVKSIITFETPSSTDWGASTDPRHFIPNLFVSVSKENLKSKIDGIESYEFEKRNYPHPRSPEALEVQARRWGIVVGKEYAEAFAVVRAVV
jgi:LmbE family N-acetylglucosaminyl deacetylase